MNDIETGLTLAAFAKWTTGESLSTRDFERIMSVIENKPINFDTPDQAKLATLQVKFRSLLYEKYIPKGQ